MSSLADAAHVVQLALTPIFLLTGLASMLNVFTTRLGRVADLAERLSREADPDERKLRRLRLRSRVLDIAVLLAAAGGALTCGAGLTLFLGSLRNAGDGHFLLFLFGGALVCLALALTAFSAETILSGRTVREQTKEVTERSVRP